jgi:large subunit ribosomal protein L6
MTKIPEIRLEIEVPAGVQMDVTEDSTVKCSGPKGSLEKRLVHPKIKIMKDKEKIGVQCELPKKKDKALTGTFSSHIRNMIIGVTEGYEYSMKTVYSHFPIKVSVKDKNVIIENFLGEKYPRDADIIGETSVEINGDELKITGINIEEVSQTAANIERATRIKKRDNRVFQDGIYITKKGR